MDHRLREVLRAVPTGTSVVMSLADAGLSLPVEQPHSEGTRLGRFVVEREIGSGGMGRVYAARDPDLNRVVAIKVLERGAYAVSAVEEFVREARIGSQLTHPGIVPVHELGVDADGRLFLVMRCVDGVSMRDALEALDQDQPIGRWTRKRLLRALVQVCDAVGSAHRQGVVHRDLKPENVMLGPFGEVQVVDWGLALRPGDLAGEAIAVYRDTTNIVGTPGYLAPEQAEGRQGVGPPADVFALGAMLVEVAAGRRAFPGRDAFERVAAALSGRPANLDGLDEVLADVVRKALALDPADRFVDAEALAIAIGDWEDGDARRQRALVRVHDGRDALGRYTVAVARHADLQIESRRQVAAVDQRLPLEHPDKQALHAILDEIETSRVAASAAWGEALAAGEAALALDPGNADARALLAEAYADRLREVEGRGETVEVGMLEGRVVEYDDGRHAAFVRGDGALTLRTDPPGATVVAREVIRSGVRWTLGPAVELGRTPLAAVPLERGSFVLTLVREGFRDTSYPVLIERGEHWDSGEVPVRLLTDDEIGAGWVYVPAGPFLQGGDAAANAITPRPLRRVWLDGFLARVLPVSVLEWKGWLDRLGDAATKWIPIQKDVPLWTRRETGWESNDGQHEWPMFAIRHADAAAFAADHGARLPLEDEWEKMARGVDGRTYPWGDRFDVALCSNLFLHRDRLAPTPVGAFPTDVSVYGVRDVAGSMRTWCSDPEFDGTPERVPMRGGCWSGPPGLSRCASRYGHRRETAESYVGARLVRYPLPR